MSLESFFASDEFNLYQTLTPVKGSKKGLFIFRIIALCIFGYGLFSSIYCTIHHNPNQDHDWIWFAYYTNQTFLANVLYFVVRIDYISIIFFFFISYNNTNFILFFFIIINSLVL